MPLAELLLPEFDEEMTATRRVLERVPDGKSAWKPHPKSMTLGRLATLVAELPAWTVNTLTRDELDIMPPGGPPPKFEVLESTARILELFDRNAKAARAASSRLRTPSSRNPGRSRWPVAPSIRGRSTPSIVAPCSIIWRIIAASLPCTCGSTTPESPRYSVLPRTSRTSRAIA